MINGYSTDHYYPNVHFVDNHFGRRWCIYNRVGVESCTEEGKTVINIIVHRNKQAHTSMHYSLIHMYNTCICIWLTYWNFSFLLYRKDGHRRRWNWERPWRWQMTQTQLEQVVLYCIRMWPVSVVLTSLFCTCITLSYSLEWGWSCESDLMRLISWD